MPPPVARALVFFTSAAVLVLEIMAGRLMAPFLGVTLETFTGIIGTVLAGIALGSWVGGRAADRYDPRGLLGPVLVVGGLGAVAAPPIVDALGPAMRAGGPIEIVLLTVLGFFLPAAVLSTVTPIVVKIRLHDLAETGSVVGSYSATATAGAIFGTFVTGFLLVATLPSRPILWVVGGLLIGGGVAVTARPSRSSGLVRLLVVAVPSVGLLQLVPSPCDTETAYYCARITTEPDRATARVLWLDTLRHSYVDLADPTYLGFRYARLFGDVFTTRLPQGAVDGLYVGGGGFTLPRYLDALHPGGRHLALELDPSLVDLAQNELGLSLDGPIEVAIGDARLTLEDAPDDGFDVVIGDAFGGPSVPWHLTTREFVSAIRTKLRDGGIYILNMIDYPPLGFATAEAATIASVFDHLLVLAPREYLDGEDGGNFVIAGSDAPFDATAISALSRDRQEPAIALTGPDAVAWIGGADVLTDDFAPVDQLITTP
jgi:MFS family permease